MSTEILNTYDEDSQLISELYGDNIETAESKKIKKSKSVVRIIQSIRSLEDLLSSSDIYKIRRALAITDGESLDLFDRLISKLIAIKKDLEKTVNI